VIVSYNDESWVTLDELRDMCSIHGDVVALAFDSKRYVGAQIGIHDPSGNKVGEVGHTRNLEYVLIAGPPDRVAHMAAPFADASLT
jgi:adenine-specific DNA-methyltransferase